MSAPVLHRIDPKAVAEGMPDVVFQCPGCNCGHGVWTSKPNHLGARWTWNGDMDRPTFDPSVLINVSNAPGTPRHVCHSYVRDGQIQFLADSTHELAGKTVPLPSA